MIIDICGGCLAAIHKDIPLSAVSMHVAKHNDLIFHVLFQNLLCIVNARMQYLGRLVPPSIEVNTEHIATVVASHHTVGVEHGNDFKDELLSHVLSLFCLLQEKVNDTLDHKR